MTPRSSNKWPMVVLFPASTWPTTTRLRLGFQLLSSIAFSYSLTTSIVLLNGLMTGGATFVTDEFDEVRDIDTGRPDDPTRDIAGAVGLLTDEVEPRGDLTTAGTLASALSELIDPGNKYKRYAYLVSWIL